ncbi:MAG: J domain-containing protein [Bdellovibrionota bacterium]
MALDLSPEKVRSYFYLLQIGIGVAFVLLLWLLRGRGSQSQFKVREADLRKPSPQKSSPASDPLAQARLKPRAAPLSLPGIRIDGAPHEILGVSSRATPEEIQKAYRDLMKRYHPDIVGRPGSREWNDAQKIAEALNRAKDALLKVTR